MPAAYLRELNFSDSGHGVPRFIRSLNYSWRRARCCSAAPSNPDVDIGACCTQLDAMAARCRQLIAEPAAAARNAAC